MIIFFLPPFLVLFTTICSTPTPSLLSNPSHHQHRRDFPWHFLSTYHRKLKHSHRAPSFFSLPMLSAKGDKTGLWPYTSENSWRWRAKSIITSSPKSSSYSNIWKKSLSIFNASIINHLKNISFSDVMKLSTNLAVISIGCYCIGYSAQSSLFARPLYDRKLFLAPLNLREASMAQYIHLPESIGVDFRSLVGVNGTVGSIIEGTFKSMALSKYLPQIVNDQSILLYGPPGCGKTSLVRALSKAFHIPIIEVQASTLLSKYVGEASQNIRTVFSIAKKMKSCIMLLDEVDALLANKKEVESELRQFLTEWDDIKRPRYRDKILLFATTNKPQVLSPPIQRRFERSHLLGLPDAKARSTLLKLCISNITTHSIDFKRLASLTKEYSHNDIVILCNVAIRNGFFRSDFYHKIMQNMQGSSINFPEALMKDMEMFSVNMQDFTAALDKVRPTSWYAKAYEINDIDIPRNEQD